MNTEHITKKFGEIKARVAFQNVGGRRPIAEDSMPISLDVQKDKGGEYFVIRKNPNVDVKDINLTVIDIRPEVRHLILMYKDKKRKVKYLCGHDEKHWFVAGIPDRDPVSNVMDAMNSLRPKEIKKESLKLKIFKSMNKLRKNKSYVRQGEWFFVPVQIDVDERFIHRKEPLSRGRGSKPHICDEVYRTGGETVYVHSQYAPSGVTEFTYKKLRKEHGNAGWTTMTRNAAVYARGSVHHPDHKVIRLGSWHQVFMNREDKSTAGASITFLD